jgi:hypothetical protein
VSGDLGAAPAPHEPRPLALVERGLWAGLLLSVAAAGLLAGRNALAPLQHPWTFGLAFWALFASAYLPLGLALGLLAALAQRALARSAGRFLVLAGGLLAIATLLGSNPRAVRLALAVQAEPARFRLLVPAALVLAAVAVTLLGLRRPAPLRVAGLLAAGSLVAALWPAPRQPASRALASAAEQTRPTRPSPLPPLLVIGLDGADWRYAEPLLQRGELPNLARLRQSGAWGPLATMQPTLSPIIWTSIATGQPGHRHGVDGFVQPRLRGVEEPLPDLHVPRRSGFRRLFQLAQERELVRDLPITSNARRLPAIWNLAARAGAPVALVGWWVTWPAEPVYGYVVSERTYYYGGRPTAAGSGERLTWPQGLYRDIAGDVQRYDQVSLEQARRFVSVGAEDWAAALRHGRGDARDALAELPYFLSLFETNRRHALSLVARGRAEFGRVPDLMVLFRLIDQACHTSLHHSDLAPEHVDSSAGAQAVFGGSVAEAYRQADAVVGELAAACGPGCNLLVLSDHGFALEEFPGGLRRYHHTRSAPPGIFLASGPAFRPGRVDDLGVLDVMPLMAHLKGLPVAEDLKGRLPTSILRPELLAAFPPRSVPTYGTRARPESLDAGAAEVDAAMLERLRALGYID